MNLKEHSPVYAKVSLNLLSIAILITGLYLGKSIFLPVFLSILFAMLLHPVVNFLTHRKVDRVIAILLCLVVSVTVVGAVVYFLSAQIGNFLDDLPTLKARLKEVEVEVKQWIRDQTNIGIREQNKYLNETTKKMAEENGSLVQQTVVSLTGFLSYVVFLPVYTFLVLYYKDLIKRFLVMVFKRSEEDKVTEVLDESQAICQQYVMGMMIELVIVFAMNATGFLILGVKYPIFLALVAALLNIVPYIGMIIANIFCVIITLISSDPSLNVLWVFGILGAVQIIDNNFLMPLIVGSKVKINAMAIILGVVIGGTLWGVPGMFLAIPGLAVMKIVFERIDALKPVSILMGDDVTRERQFKNPLKSAFIRSSKTAQKKS